MDNNSYDSDETQEGEPLYISNGLTIGLNKYDFTAFLLNMLFIDQVHDFRSTEMRNHGDIPVPNGFEDDKLTAFHQIKCMLYGTMCIMANGLQDGLLHQLYIALFTNINNPFEMMKDNILHNNISQWDGNWQDKMDDYIISPFYKDNFFNINGKSDLIYKRFYKNWSDYMIEGEIGDGHYYRYYHSLIFTNPHWINRLNDIKTKLVLPFGGEVSRIRKLTEKLIKDPDYISLIEEIEEYQYIVCNGIFIDTYIKPIMDIIKGILTIIIGDDFTQNPSYPQSWLNEIVEMIYWLLVNEGGDIIYTGDTIEQRIGLLLERKQDIFVEHIDDGYYEIFTGIDELLADSEGSLCIMNNAGSLKKMLRIFGDNKETIDNATNSLIKSEIEYLDPQKEPAHFIIPSGPPGSRPGIYKYNIVNNDNNSYISIYRNYNKIQFIYAHHQGNPIIKNISIYDYIGNVAGGICGKSCMCPKPSWKNITRDVVYKKTVVEYNNILQGMINGVIIGDNFKNIIYYQLSKTLGDYSQIFSSIHNTLGLDSRNGEQYNIINYSNGYRLDQNTRMIIHNDFAATYANYRIIKSLIGNNSNLELVSDYYLLFSIGEKNYVFNHTF